MLTNNARMPDQYIYTGIRALIVRISPKLDLPLTKSARMPVHKKYFNSIFILPWIFFRIYFCLKFREIKYLFFNFLKMFGCLAMVYAIKFVKHFTLCVTAIAE